MFVASEQGDVMSPDRLEAMAACWSGSPPSLHVKSARNRLFMQSDAVLHAGWFVITVSV